MQSFHAAIQHFGKAGEIGHITDGYAGITQLFPGVVLGLFWKRTTMAGIFTGIAVGVGIVAFLMLTKRDPFFDVSAGFLGLCANFAVAVTFGLFAPRRQVSIY